MAEATQRHIENLEDRIPLVSNGSGSGVMMGNGTSPSKVSTATTDTEDVESPLSVTTSEAQKAELYKFMFAVGGIYGAFIFYGNLQEDVFSYRDEKGLAFEYAWFLLFLEAIANILFAVVGQRIHHGKIAGSLYMRQFAITGASQVFSKAFTSLALAKGLSFPVATLAKSGKMAPVMVGQLLLGGASYTVREYAQVGAIVFGTALLSLCKKESDGRSSSLGVFFILLSLVMDGITAGIQKRLKSDMTLVGVTPKPFEFMLFTNISMMCIAFVLALSLHEFSNGWHFVVEHVSFVGKVVAFCLCSAVGQSFVFYTVVHFDPLVCSTVTTTRKIFSVLLSIFLKGHELTYSGWAGVSVAVGGILSEVHSKARGKRKGVKSKVSM